MVVAALVFVWPRQLRAVDALLFQDTFVKNTLVEPQPPLRTHYLTINRKHSAYLQFDFGSILPAGTTGEQIERAILRIYIAFNYSKIGPSSGGQDPFTVYPEVGVYGLTEPFTEDREDAPSQRDAARTDYAEIRGSRFYVDFDVTPLVRAWISKARPNFGLALVAEPTPGAGDPRQTQPADLRIPTKENPTNSREARLQLVLRPAPVAP